MKYITQNKPAREQCDCAPHKESYESHDKQQILYYFRCVAKAVARKNFILRCNRHTVKVIPSMWWQSEQLGALRIMLNTSLHIVVSLMHGIDEGQRDFGSNRTIREELASDELFRQQYGYKSLHPLSEPR